MPKSYLDLNPSPRVLMGPGPSDVHPRVLRAMATPLLGHLDPEFLAIMNEVKELLQYVFQTQNELALPVPGTGSAGMEAAIGNVLEPGDTIVIGVNGFFGQRMCEMAARCGAQVVPVQTPWGRIVEPDDIAQALRGCQAKVVAVVHAETSTGVLQPLQPIADLAHAHGALFLVDTVTSLGGHPVKVDEWGLDVCYSGTQKCLGAPPGLAPLTLSSRAAEVLHQRRSKVPCWYLDLSLLERYWGQERVYHHTAPISLHYALREALRLVAEEGLEARCQRHRLNQQALIAGVQALGLEPFVADEAQRLWSLTTVRVPAGLEEAKVRAQLLQEFGIEIGGGLGELKGRIWRVGLMGYSSSRRNVLLFLGALEHVLIAQGYSPQGSGVHAAGEVYRRAT